LSDDQLAYYGFLNINKPLGMTSHDVVARVRRLLRQAIGSKKVGHAGTLDPLATGVLVVCVQQATRLSDYAMHGTKQYRAEITLGISTETYDAEGDITAQVDASAITLDQIMGVLPQFTGDIQQLPPMYSAIKKEGKKLYELARAGKTVELEARPVTIHNVEVLDWQSPQLTVTVTCSPGTYIRSLAHDLGQALGVGAYLSGLIRTRSGTFSLENAVELDALMDDDKWQQHIIPPRIALADLPAIHTTADQWQELVHGRYIERQEDDPSERAFAYTPDGQLGAILQQRGSHWKPNKVLLPQA